MDTAQRGKNPRSTYSTFLLSIVRVSLHQISSAHNLHCAPSERTLVESLDGTREIEDNSRWLGGINVLEQEQWQEQTRAESPDCQKPGLDHSLLNGRKIKRRRNVKNIITIQQVRD
jgi:hypothetical protein